MRSRESTLSDGAAITPPAERHRNAERSVPLFQFNWTETQFSCSFVGGKILCPLSVQLSSINLKTILDV